MAWPVLVFDIESIPDVDGLRALRAAPPDQTDEQVYGGWLEERKAKGQSDFMAKDQKLWRISARVVPTPEKSCSKIYDELQTLMAGDPIQLTGIAPMIEQAQKDIFTNHGRSQKFPLRSLR